MDEHNPLERKNITIKGDIIGLWTWFVPKEPKYYSIFKFLIAVWIIAVLPVYFIGMDHNGVLEVVYWLWRTSIFGVWSDGTPYVCGYDLAKLCSRKITGGGDFFGFLGFFLGTVITIRLVVLCLKMLENALGTDIISRLLNRFLPDTKPPSSLDKEP